MRDRGPPRSGAPGRPELLLSSGGYDLTAGLFGSATKKHDYALTVRARGTETLYLAGLDALGKGYEGTGRQGTSA